MQNIFGSIFNVGIQINLKENKTLIQFTEMDRQLDNGFMCDKKIFRPVRFEKHSATDFANDFDNTSIWNFNRHTNIFTFYWRNFQQTF